MNLRSNFFESRIHPRQFGLRALLTLLSLVLLSACAQLPPIDEWNTARAAYDAAKDNDAPRYVPSLWFNADQAYREAQRAYHDQYYDTAKEDFIESRQLSEQAENAARLARQQSGEVVP